MSKPVAYAVTFVLCIVLQFAVSPALELSGCAPNFLLIPVLLVSLRSGACLGSVAGFALGLLYDFAGSGTVGCMALSFSLVALIVGLLAGGMDLSSGGAHAIVAIASAFVVELAYAIANAMTNADAGGMFAELVGYSLPVALYTAVFAVIALVTMRLVIADDMSGSFPSAGGYIIGSSQGRSLFGPK